MAIYHLSAQIVSRSQGRSAVAAAAYRAGEKLHDERTDKTHDFTKKSDVVNKAILAPTNAPDWVHDREQLWNKVEAKEARKDAQLVREINIALPRELNDEQNWKLACDFVSKEFIAKGMVADVTFHRGSGGWRRGNDSINSVGNRDISDSNDITLYSKGLSASSDITPDSVANTQTTQSNLTNQLN